jgi:putative addiction module component (TIGR02574 family)
MRMDFKALEKEALDLPASERGKLARQLLESLDSLSEAELDAPWLDEAERRAEQLDRGEADMLSSEEVGRKARTLLK